MIREKLSSVYLNCKSIDSIGVDGNFMGLLKVFLD